MPDITPLSSRGDIDVLLTSFYEGALVDDLLGPAFRHAQLDLRTHLPRIGDFWERTLLATGRYDGQPMVTHRRLHDTFPLTPPMFARWLELWRDAVDSRFDGANATRAKDTAQRVADALQRQLHDGRTLLQIGHCQAEGERT